MLQSSLVRIGFARRAAELATCRPLLSPTLLHALAASPTVFHSPAPRAAPSRLPSSAARETLTEFVQRLPPDAQLPAYLSLGDPFLLQRHDRQT